MTTLALLLSIAVAPPCAAGVSKGAAPEAGPVQLSLPLDAPAASATVSPEAALSGRSAAPLGGLAAQPLPAAEAGAQGPASVGAEMSRVSGEIVPDLKATREGGDGDAAAGGQAIQDALEGAGGRPSVLLPIYSSEPAAKPRHTPLETSSALPASFRYAHASAAEAVKAAKLGTARDLRFVEAYRHDGGWEFHFVAGGRDVKVYARDGHQPADRAWVGAEFKPDSSLGLDPMRFSQQISGSPNDAVQAAAKKLGVPAETTGLSLWTLPKSSILWYVVDAEDGRRVAVSVRSGSLRMLDAGPGRDKIEAAARALAGNKGYPFSETEYRAAYAGYVGMLRQDGATRAQLALFARLMAETPIRGGRFNSWSGD